MQINELYPILATSDMAVSLEFYEKTLGFTITFTWPEKEPITHAGIIAGKDVNGSIIHFHLSITDKPVKTSGWLYFNVNDVDQMYQDISEKVTITVELNEFPWGYREFETVDPDGHRLRFTQELPHHETSEH